MSISSNIIGVPNIYNNCYSSYPILSEYHLNEINSSKVIDYSNNKYHGTYGTGTTKPNRTSQGYSFDGTQYFTFPLGALGNKTNFSMLAVFKTTTNNGQRILSASPNDYFNFYYYSDTMAFSVYPSGIEATGAANTVNKWACCVGVFRPNSSVDVYFNKNKVGSTNITGNTFGVEDSFVSCGRDVFGNYFFGTIATIITYSISLTDTQVSNETTKIMGILGSRGIILGN